MGGSREEQGYPGAGKSRLRVLPSLLSLSLWLQNPALQLKTGFLRESKAEPAFFRKSLVCSQASLKPPSSARSPPSFFLC